MRRVMLAVVLVTSCGSQRRPPPVAPQIRVDTVIVTRVVEPPLPEGAAQELCLATGVTAQVYITAAGDTLVGARRVRLSELRPALTFAGSYAGERNWFTEGALVRFEGRSYSKLGADRIRVCDELKLVGDYDGVPVFAEVTAPHALPMIVLPIRPGVFQDYLRVSR